MEKEKYTIDQHKCKICGKEFKNSKGRNTHIRFKHPEITIGQYYQKYYPRYCKVCNKLLEFKGSLYLQYIFCSQKCLSKDFSTREGFNKGIQKYKTEFLLEILKELHKKYKGYVTQRMVKEDGRVCYQTYHDYFGSFTEACKQAEVPNLGQHNPRKHFKEDIIKKVQKLYEDKKEKISFDLIERNTNISKQAIYQFFKSIGELCDVANVPYFMEDKLVGKPVNNMLKIIIDSNEKKPYNFKNSVFQRLNVGDYKSAELYKGVVFERKSIGDLKSTMSGGSNTKRFGREMNRAREDECYVLIIIDGTKEDFFSRNPYGRMTNKAIYHNIKLFGSIYADVCQFVFTGSRARSKSVVTFCAYLRPEDLIYVDYQSIIDDCDGMSIDDMRKLLKEFIN